MNNNRYISYISQFVSCFVLIKKKYLPIMIKEITVCKCSDVKLCLDTFPIINYYIGRWYVCFVLIPTDVMKYQNRKKSKPSI